MMSSAPGPIQGTIVDRFCLNKQGSSRETWHIVIDIGDLSLSFRPGDSIGIFPKNSPDVVHELISYFQLSPESPVLIPNPAASSSLPLSVFLSDVVDLSFVPQRLVDVLSKTVASHEDRSLLLSALASGETFEGYDVLHFLKGFIPHKVSFVDIVPCLPRMRPRLYSISSGPSVHSQRIELTVARVRYEINGRLRNGLCSNYLICSAPLHEPSLRLFHQPSKHFYFPIAEKRPLVMIGAGTGVAPFRAFMQEVEVGAICVPTCWLFFGERQSTTDFFYEDFWHAQVESGRLRLDLAFSQDQEEKIYVQHRMWQRRADLWRWLSDGAFVLVCGNAKKMAKDVDACLASIAASEGGLSSEESLSFLRSLRHQGRYLRDVY